MISYDVRSISDWKYHKTGVPFEQKEVKRKANFEASKQFKEKLRASKE